MDNNLTIEELFQQYKQDVNNFLLYYLRTTDVDDPFQETFIRAYKALNQGSSITNPRSWLISIARNAANDYIRKEKSYLKKLMHFSKQQIQPEQQTVEDKMELDEQNRVLLQGIYRMKKSYQEVVLLRGIKDFNVTETAAILNWSENKVRVTYHRALNKLNNVLNKGGELGEFEGRAETPAKRNRDFNGTGK
ncbi:RNA polymerase sigma factor [Gracilibacillus oryzae]|uniref:RNA polymerase sigma factor n=1 Tax=Gracilibacillus oryzae TaxID=1672701 RepID=A0A7C8GRX0_9BACI|nr:RNA polymerase sigma factor [Gracilibacillus oryzae]KAB8129195.1 RNA polymerase sigma factor [Gracilibacillus oryzae]